LSLIRQSSLAEAKGGVLQRSQYVLISTMRQIVSKTFSMHLLKASDIICFSFYFLDIIAFVFIEDI
jgi:hypothetical protein